MALHLYLFGAPRCEQDGRALHIQRRKGMALIAYLALNPRPQARDFLATLLYPESDNARAYLRRDLSEIRQQMGDVVLTAEGKVSLDTGDDLWVDVIAFETQLELVATHGHFPEMPCSDCLAALHAALDLYKDQFLAGFTLPDCPEFNEWQFFEAQSLRQSLAEALKKMIAWHTRRQAFAEAIEHARRWLSLDPLHEPAQRRLMELYAANGQRAAALRQYEECVRLLDEELGIAPAPETTSLFEAIRTRQFEQPAPAGPPAKPSPPAHNLPAQTTTFVGRNEEIAEIRQILSDANCRLLTLLGPGGIGKTRLAIEAARETAFADGVWFVPLAPLSAPISLPGAVADALALRLQGEDRPQQTLLKQLQDRELLLLLDNFEHLLPRGAEFIVDLLQGAPGLKLLVTTRERLNLSAEWVFSVGGLEFPAEPEIDDVASCGAVQLFVHRARQAVGDFAMQPDTQAAIARICRLTEGMPLALELAATWTTILSCSEIAGEIQRGLDFLRSSLRDLPDRHRSIRAVFDVSWQLLDDVERRVFCQLSIFRGGFTRTAAESICHVTGANRSILSILASLVAKSFLKRSASGRYEIHELLRQYGAARLTREPDVEEATRNRHCEYYLSFCAAQEVRLKGPEQLEALQELGSERANLRVAWQYAARHGRSRLLLEAAEAIWLFLQQNSHSSFQEQALLYEEALSGLQQRVNGAETATEEDELALAKLQGFSAGTYMRLGDYERALALLQESLPRLRRLEAWREVALALNELAATVHRQGDYEAERAYLEESLTRAREAGDRWLTGYSLNDLGMVWHLLGDTQQAQRLSRKSAALFRRLGDRRGLGFAFNNLGLFAFHLGAYDEADAFYRECLSIRQASGDQWGVAAALSHLALVAKARGDTAAARANLLKALKAAEQAGATSQLLDTLVMLAALLHDEGETARAQMIVRCCLPHPSLSDAGRAQAEELAEVWSDWTSISPHPEEPDSLDALVDALLADDDL